MNSLSRSGRLSTTTGWFMVRKPGLALVGEIRMRIRTVLAGLTAAGLMAFPAMADDGQYGPQLTRMLSEAAAGSCSIGLMQSTVLDACNAQIEGMSPALRSLGALESVTFVSAEDTAQGRVETYNVKFAGGRTMTWVIGLEVEGKFGVVGSGG